MSRFRRSAACLGAVATLFAAAAGGAAPASAATCATGTWNVLNLGNDSTAWPVRYESAHFVVRVENANVNSVSSAQAQDGLNRLERIWADDMGRVGWPEPFCGTASKYKTNIFVNPTYGLTGGGRGDDRDMSMWIYPGALGDSWGLAHEFAHTLQQNSGGNRDSQYGGWIWEDHANFMARQFTDNRSRTHCSEVRAAITWEYWGSTRDRYCSFSYLEYLKNTYGYAAVNRMWSEAPKTNNPARLTNDPILTLRDANGWSQSQLNDTFGTWAMRNVNWDYTDPDGLDLGAQMRKNYGDNNSTPWGLFGQRRTRLVEIDNSKGQYVVNRWQAPQRYGYNLVQLYPAAGASSVTVQFRGVTQASRPSLGSGALSTDPGTNGNPSDASAPNSGWRWGAVAIQSDGTSRYSALQRSASGDLTVPVQSGDKSLWLVVVGAPTEHNKIFWDQSYRSIYRYPWKVALVGAKPEGFQPGAGDAPSGFHRHPYGGGLVANSANVAPTAYVGADAKVLGGSVLDNARIQDYAVITNGTVKGNAVVGGVSYLFRNWTVQDQAKVFITRWSQSAENLTISGAASLYGDLEIYTSVDRGAYAGYVGPGTLTQNGGGSALTAVPDEVTAPVAAGFPDDSRPGALVGVGSGRCLDIPASGAPAPISTVLWDCNGNSVQRWTWTAKKELRTPDGKCLDAWNLGRTNGTTVTTWSCNGGAHQQWDINADGTVVNVNSKLCLDAENFGTTNGTRVFLWTCLGNSNQKWTLRAP